MAEIKNPAHVLVEITPDNIRLRKKYLTSIERRQAYRDAKALEEE